MNPTQTKNAFGCLELSPEINRQLDKLGFTTPTPIQAEAIPHALAGRDVIGIAQTGTGKTFAFGLPMIEKLLNSHQGMALILAPTRELALQIDEELKKVGAALGLKTAVLIGGAPMNKQVNDLKRRPNVIVATPGRLKDHLWQKTCTLRFVSMVVLDEADRMFDMGFAPIVKHILDQVPTNRQTMLFSATMAKEVNDLANNYLTDPVRVEVTPQGTATELVEQEVHMVEKDKKADLLASVLYENHGTVLVFSRTRHGAKRIARSVRDMGHTAAELHSDRTLAQRKTALAGFKSGEYRVLVATDIAARGIDVKDIELVVNYDLPDCIEDYVHRIGRTGRAGATGRAVTFALPEQHRDVRHIERLIGRELAVVTGSLPEVRRTPQKNVDRPHPKAQGFRGNNPPARSEASAPRSRDQRPFSPKKPREEGSPAIVEVRPERSQRPFSPKKPGPSAQPPVPVEAVEPAKHMRPKPNGTPKQFQKPAKKPRWAKPANGQHNGQARSANPSGPQAHRPGIGGNNGNRTDRPAFGGGRSGPKRFGKPRR